MTHPEHDDIVRRLDDLEVKASFTEDLLDRLDAVIVRQQDQIDRLTAELHALKAQAVAAGESPPRSLRDELPPHY
jgi:SlyX protein